MLRGLVRRCPKNRAKCCKFWLLDEEEEIRKAKLVRMGLLDSTLPETPSTNKRKRASDRSSPVRESGIRLAFEVKEEYSPTTLADEGMQILCLTFPKKC